MRKFLPLATVLLVSAPFATADVLIVDPSGSQGYSQIQAAVDAAQDGDLILVESGTYAGFVLDQRTLTVRADANASVIVAGEVAVLGTPAGGRVILGELDITPPVNFPQPALDGLTVHDNLGFVRIQGCTITGGFAGDAGTGGIGVSVQNSLRTVLVGCWVTGGTGGGDPAATSLGGPGGLGLRTQQSATALYDCFVFGGTGGAADFGVQQQGGPAGDGVEVASFGLFASKSQIRGGIGGQGGQGGKGGDGLVVQAGAQAQLLAVQLQPGSGGSGIGGVQGDPGLPFVNLGTITNLSGKARVFSGPAHATGGTQVSIQVTGDPGDEVWIAAGKAPAHVPTLAYSGLWLVQRPLPLTKAPLAVIGAGGQATVSFPVAALPAGVASRDLYLQGLVRTVGGELRLGGPMHVTVQ